MSKEKEEKKFVIDAFLLGEVRRALIEDVDFLENPGSHYPSPPHRIKKILNDLDSSLYLLVEEKETEE